MKNATAIYSGGGIYLFFGQLGKGRYFMADDCNYDVTIFDADPLSVDLDTALSFEWQNDHIVRYMPEKESKSVFVAMLKWILKHEPDGNYAPCELERDLQALEEVTK